MKFTPVTGGRPVWSNTYYYYISLSVSTSPSVRLIIFQGRSNYNDPPAPPPPAYSPLHFAWWSRAKLSSENYNSKIRLLNKTKSFLSPDTPLWLCIQNLNLSVHHFEPDNFQWFALFSFKFQSTRKYFTEEGPGGGGGGGELATISENKNILWIVCSSNHVSRIWHRMADLLSNKSIKINWMPFVSVLTMITQNNEVQAFYGHLL